MTFSWLFEQLGLYQFCCANFSLTGFDLMEFVDLVLLKVHKVMFLIQSMPHSKSHLIRVFAEYCKCNFSLS